MGPVRQPSVSPFAGHARPRAIAIATVQALLIGAPGAWLAGHLPAAHAQGAQGAQSADARRAEAQKPYAIPPGPLAAALNRFGRDAGVMLSFSTEQTNGLQSKGLNGSHGVQSGLRALLAGTDLEAVVQANGGYVLRKEVAPPPAPAPSATATREAESTLPEIHVSAARTPEMATGRVHGHVAKRSATGSKTDVPIVEVPQSLSVITADELAGRAVSTVKEAVGYTAGVTPSASFDLREDLTTFRGFPFDWASFYLDGLAMPSTTYGVSTSEPYGMERIEVLRGPASMLYGQNSTGGLLNMVSKRPVAEPLHELQVQLGSHDRKQLAFDLGGPIASGSEWTYRLVGLVRRSDTSVDFVEDNRTFLAPALTWKPSAATSLTLLASLLNDDLGHSGGTSAFLPASGIALPNPNGTIDRDTYGGEPGFDFYKKKQMSVGYEFLHRFDDTWQFTQNLRWRKVDLDYQTAYGLGLLASDPSRRTLRRGAFGSFGENEALAVDSQLQAKWVQAGIEHTTLIGLDLKRTQLDEKRYFGFTGPAIDIFSPVYGAGLALPATPDTDQSVEIRQAGLYAQDQMKFDQRWLLTLGGRWDAASHEVENRLKATTSRLTEGKATGRVGLTYLFDNGLAPYASMATSFTPTLASNDYGPPFKARTGKQREVGLKYQPPGSNALYTAAVFELTQRNALTADPDQVNHPAGQVQVGEYRSRGLELEAKTEITPSLSLLAAYTYLDAEVTQSNDGNVGNTPKGIPRNTVSAWASYKFRGEALRGLGVGLGARYVGKRPSADAAGYYMVPSFTLLDAAVSYDTGEWLFALNVSNLTDKVTYDCWYARCWYGPSRQVLATATVRW